MNEMREYLASHTGPVLFLIVSAQQWTWKTRPRPKSVTPATIISLGKV